MHSRVQREAETPLNSVMFILFRCKFVLKTPSAACLENVSAARSAQRDKNGRIEFHLLAQSWSALSPSLEYASTIRQCPDAACTITTFPIYLKLNFISILYLNLNLSSLTIYHFYFSFNNLITVLLQTNNNNHHSTVQLLCYIFSLSLFCLFIRLFSPISQTCAARLNEKQIISKL